jgi:predicted O-linked N-acetylglucosamine transferase (SPINDLY family)
MIGEKLKDADPALDVMASDRKVLQVACQDFTNYLKFHWNLIGKEANQCELVEKLEVLYKENADELDDFLTVWCNIWFKKWKQRVQLLIGNQNANKWCKMAKTITNAEPLWNKIERKQELQEVVIATLIKNGEICGTDILAENLLKLELGEKSVKNLSDKERVFATLNNTLRRAREMAQSRGPLIFVKVDKGYYSTAAE